MVASADTNGDGEVRRSCSLHPPLLRLVPVNLASFRHASVRAAWCCTLALV
jgi:hypothetical protein